MLKQIKNKNAGRLAEISANRYRHYLGHRAIFYLEAPFNKYIRGETRGVDPAGTGIPDGSMCLILDGGYSRGLSEEIAWVRVLLDTKAFGGAKVGYMDPTNIGKIFV